MTEQTYLKLNNGDKNASIGVGVFQVLAEKTKENILEALSLGYRHIDTAHAYQNEREVGEAIITSGIPREEIYVTSKLWPSDYNDEQAIDRMLARMNLEYIDLLLLHQQFGEYLTAYRLMEKAVSEGKVRSIGLSNFESNRLEEVLEFAIIKPAAIQVECHPNYQQASLKERIKPYSNVIESWYPLGHGDSELLKETIFVEFSEKYHKTSAQVILRWHIQMGHVVFPRSLNHLAENIDIFDFCLSSDEMKKIATLNRNNVILQ